jgi:polyhydroxyalkanoate synthase
LRAPIFAVGTERDHVAPWRSTFKLHLLTDAEITYVLTSGGHNAGIVSEPGHRGRHYRVQTRIENEAYIDPDRWLTSADRREGSWWPEWVAWLQHRSSDPTEPPLMGNPEAGLPLLTDAPGLYVLGSGS